MSEKKDHEQQLSGIFEPNNDGGRIRRPRRDYAADPNDPVIPRAHAQRLGLRGGEWVVAQPPTGRRNGRRKSAITDVTTINDLPADKWLETKKFEDMTAIDPTDRLRFECPDGSVSMRVVDLMAPIGFGQRALIAAPPRTGKTVMLQQMAHGVATNHPDAHLMVLLVDERPEEVTDMRRNVRGEVVASSNDHDAANHVRLTKLMISNAKRRVEAGQDVVLFLDSLTRLGRAFNTRVRGGGRIMSGGLDITALQEPKTVFGAARNIEGGGSLTIVATALIETGSRMDEVIFNEFKGTGNMEIMLSRQLADRRIWPAIDLQLSGTRKEELLLSPDELDASHRIRRTLLSRQPEQAMTGLTEQMSKHDNNAAFVESIKALPNR